MSPQPTDPHDEALRLLGELRTTLVSMPYPAMMADDGFVTMLDLCDIHVGSLERMIELHRLLMDDDDG